VNSAGKFVMTKQNLFQSLRPLLTLATLLLIGVLVYLGLEWGGAEKITEAVKPPTPVSATHIGRPAPDFTVPASRVWAKQDFRFSSLKGYPVVLHFWATWCGPCLQELPELLRLAEAQRPQGVSFVAVAIDQSWNDLEKFFSVHPELRALTERMVVLLDPDSEVANAYGSSRFPETFLINDAMLIDNKFIGAQNWTDPRVEAFLKTLRSAP
jgi:cytochrome c biogenesis protein CcmG/thiol:disulfide interchange protein DsbE